MLIIRTEFKAVHEVQTVSNSQCKHVLRRLTLQTASQVHGIAGEALPAVVLRAPQIQGCFPQLSCSFLIWFCTSCSPSRTVFLTWILMYSFTPPHCALSSAPSTNPRLCRECAFPPPMMFTEVWWTNCMESSHISREILPRYSESPCWGCLLPHIITWVPPPPPL